MTNEPLSRRSLLASAAGFAGAAIGVASTAYSAETAKTGKLIKRPVEGASTSALPAGEKLMQDHGILGRTLLIYENLARSFRAGKTDSEDALSGATDIMVKYIQGHHERLEELMVFPELTRANAHPKLIATLVSQHQTGRNIVQRVQSSGRTPLRTAAGREDMAELLEGLAVMFRPHALREDTVVFPELRKLMNAEKYAEFSQRLETLDQKMINKTDLENLVNQLTSMETALGIHDLSKFTAQDS
jgi:hemerythrin-like domain-containing protein